MSRITVCCLALMVQAGIAAADSPEPSRRETHIRAGHGQTIVEVQHQPTPAGVLAGTTEVTYPHPRPRLAGFSPLVAITTSDAAHPLGDIELWAHEVTTSFTGELLNPFAADPFVVGVLDSGASVDLAAGTFADTLGLYGAALTPNVIPIGGVGGTTDAYVSYPVGFFAAGLSAIDTAGVLDFGALVGHWNVCGLAAPAIDCGNGEVLSAVIGTPFMAFYNSIIRVDTPRRVTVSDATYASPDVEILPLGETIPTYSHEIAMEFGPAAFITTASYFPDYEFLVTPITPTMLSELGISPTSGAFFATVRLRQGEATPDNPATSFRFMVDTGAQSSIISQSVAAQLSLPIEPDFTVDVCGVGGLVEGVEGFYIDYVKIDARGGALEFSRAPFVVLSIASPEGGTIDGVLGMNFFWNRNVVFEPTWELVSTDPEIYMLSETFLRVSSPVGVAYGDFDVDLDVDAGDAGMFMSCFTGPGPDLVSPECDHLDGDFDGDVDLVEYQQFQQCFSDSDVTANPTCGF
ncbi:MAG: retroviral-like aspartic protease family protein [Planctomycetes bacterium]|nr:retroviral-like aspartic protease family protein [Planctomycetota bacterium]